MSQGYEKGKLIVKMFGDFSMQYEGKFLRESKTSQSHFMYLMQMLLHFRKSGVSRGDLEEVMFGDRDIDDIHHSLRSVVYNARKKLENAGLPKVNYIIHKNGRLFWTDEIPVEEDASTFEELYMASTQAKTEDERLELLLKTCRCYTGEFLGTYGSLLWVASESRRYRSMFYQCVEDAADILRKREDYMQLEQLGIYAASAAPFSDWETLTLEALVGLGRYVEAGKFYARTVQMYLEERGDQAFG